MSIDAYQIGLETANNILLNFLWNQGYIQVFLLHSKLVKSSRGRFRSSAARDDTSDVLLIAERMFELATARGENDEALVWNDLQTSWPEIENAADRAEEAGIRAEAEQTRLAI